MRRCFRYFLHIFLIHLVFKYKSFIIKWIWKSIVSSPILPLSQSPTYSLFFPHFRPFSCTLHPQSRTNKSSQPRKSSALKPITMQPQLWKKSLSSSLIATLGVLNKPRVNFQQGVKIQLLPVWVHAWWSMEANKSTQPSKWMTCIVCILQHGNGKSSLQWRHPILILIHWHLPSMMKICWFLARNYGYFVLREWIGSYRKETYLEAYGKKCKALSYLFNCDAAQR